jgi:hypothetical protein
MKKKIKDLTLEEIKIICRKSIECECCPLRKISPCPATIYDEDLESEVEVYEN